MKLFRSKQPASSPARRRAFSGSKGAGRRQAENQTGEQTLEQRYAFRRNRTLTGSLSSEVDSAKVNNMELRSPRVQGHDLRAHRRRVLGVLSVVLLVAGGLGYLVYQSIAAPKVTAATPTSIDSALYEQKVGEYLSTRFQQRLRSTLDTTALTSYLQDHGAPEVASVSPETSYAGFGASRFTFIMRQPVVVWRTGDHTYYVDALGNAFEKNYYAGPSVEVVDQTGIQAAGNQVLASDRLLGFIGRVIGRLNTQGHTVTKVVLPENTTRQVAVYTETVAYPVKFSVDRSAGEQAEDAARSIKYLQTRGVTPQYIDVRVAGKAYYM